MVCVAKVRWPGVLRVSILSALIASLVSGCGHVEKSPLLASVVPPSADVVSSGVLPSDSGESELTVETAGAAGAFAIIPTAPKGDAGALVPKKRIAGLSLTESGLQDALQMMIRGTGLTLRVNGGARAMERVGPVAIHNVSGDLVDALNLLGKSMGFFWRVDGGVLTVEPEQAFIVQLPPAVLDDSLAGMTNTIAQLGGRDVYLDRSARNLVFRANARALESIDGYLKSVRASRAMVVYELKIYQVDLADSSQRGINWRNFSGSSLSRSKGLASTSDPSASVGTGVDLAKAFSVSQSGGGFGGVILGPHFSLNALVEFLTTQGSVKTLSQPRLAVMNGGVGRLRIGSTETVISKVGTNLAQTLTQTQVETRDLRTGVELALRGDISDGTVYTQVHLAVTDLTDRTRYQALGIDMMLPTTGDNELKTDIRLPPGYTALLGGITTSKLNKQRNVGMAVNSTQDDQTQSELVIVIRSRVVKFDESSRSVATGS